MSSCEKGEGSKQGHKNDVLVGTLERDGQNIKTRHLLNPSSELSVVALHGDEGSGKTTLARWLYNDPEVSHHFHIRVWFSANTGRDLPETLLNSLTSVSEATWMMEAMDRLELSSRISRKLNKRRYLIVLDGVCSSHDIWNNVLNLLDLSKNDRGSRIIVTCRRPEDAAGHKLPEQVHKMELLTEADCWELFRLRSGKRDADPHNAQIKDLIIRCRGLPLRILVVAGMFSGNITRDWKTKPPSQSQRNGLNYILQLSYWTLSIDLKEHLGYMAQFPPEKGISVEKLCLLWMAKGTALKGNDITPLEVAKGIYNQLIATSLVIGDNVSASLRFPSCKILPWFQSMCRNELELNDHVVVLDGERNISQTKETINSAKKLAIYLNKLRDKDVRSIIKAASGIQSILFFDVMNSEQSHGKSFEKLKKFKSTLAVLEFNGVSFKEATLPPGMDKLKCLKYLSFQGCNLRELSSSIISTFKCLETLDLRVIASSGVMTIPNVLQKLSKLKHLYFPQAYQCAESEKLKLDTLPNLEILENFHAKVCDSHDLRSLEKLQILTCLMVGENNKQDSDNIIHAMDKIIRCKQLHHTSLVVKLDAYREENLKIVEAIFRCNGINFLEIKGFLGWLKSLAQIGSNFVKMVLDKSEFSYSIDPLRKLGQGLPNLTSLVLRNDALKEKKMHFRSGYFPQLTSLQLEALQSLETLEVEKGALPCLATLTIKQCMKLTMPPGGLEKMKTLEELMTDRQETQVQDINERRKGKGYKSLTVKYL